jgi:hypothetical protein
VKGMIANSFNVKYIFRCTELWQAPLTHNTMLANGFYVQYYTFASDTIACPWIMEQLRRLIKVLRFPELRGAFPIALRSAPSSGGNRTISKQLLPLLSSPLRSTHPFEPLSRLAVQRGPSLHQGKSGLL